MASGASATNGFGWLRVDPIQSAGTPRPVVEECPEERVIAAAGLSFDSLYRDYRRKVYATVHHVMGPSDEVEDVVQNVFLEVYRSLGRYQGQAQLSTWIYRISVNVALQYIRKRRRRRVFLFFGGDDEREVENQGVDESPRMEHRAAIKRLYEVLDKLNDKKRAVFVLHELEGLPVERIAEVCDIPLNTVRSRLLAARTDVMERMRKAGMLENES